jgi:hypothetical protein
MTEFVLDKILKIFENPDSSIPTFKRSEFDWMLKNKYLAVEYVISKNRDIRSNIGNINWKAPHGAVLNRCSSIYLFRKFRNVTVFVSICDSEPPVSVQFISH